jgi:hypothetical protein
MAPGRRSIEFSLAATVQVAALLIAVASPLSHLKARDSATSASSSAAATAQETSTADIRKLPRGKKLILKDGSFQLVREYHVQGDRVRYYSTDSSQWEQIPAALVDWDATKKLEADEAASDAAALAKVHKQEEARRAEPLDIDASLEVAPGIFLPPGERLFLFDGKAVLPLTRPKPARNLRKAGCSNRCWFPCPSFPRGMPCPFRGRAPSSASGTAGPSFTCARRTRANPPWN